MMIRLIVGLSLAILILGGIFFYQYNRQLKIMSVQRDRSKSINLVSTTKHFCPNQAKIIARDERGLLSENVVNIGDCRYIPLDSFIGKKPKVNELFVKIDKALAFRIYLRDTANIQIRGQLMIGDLNDDNIIDQTDEEIVKEALFSQNDDLDLDRDGQVTIMDWATIALNKGVGVEHPQRKSWTKE